MIEPDVPAPLNTQPPAPNRKLHWPSILIAVGGILVFLTLLTSVILLFVSGVISFSDPQSVSSGEPSQIFSYAAAGALISFLILPTAILAIRRLAGKPPTTGLLATRLKTRLISTLLVVYLVVLAGGGFLAELPRLDWLFMPVLNVLVLSLPVIILFWLGTKDLPPSSPQRNWTTFGLGMTLSPLIIVIIELVAIFIGIFLVILVLSVFIPDLPARVQEFALMMETAQATSQFPEEEIIPLLQSPTVVGVLLIFVSGIVPLVEEAIKPLGVWLLAGRKLTARDGWVLGLLSGAGFALVENLGNLASGTGWTFLALARGGATALHMFNTAIIGYTFVLSRRQKKWRWVILAFLGTLLLHALWNSVAVLASISSITSLAEDASWPIGYLLILIIATIGTTFGIHWVNRRLAGENKLVTESEN